MKFQHGLSTTREYKAWADMLRRCTSPKSADFQEYGGRGITVCKRWSSFVMFLSDMGKRPSKHHSLDRINNSGNYTPSNCRWSTPKEQANNTRHNTLLSHDGKTMTLSQWAQELSINTATLSVRLGRYGWSVERALTQAVDTSKNWHARRSP
jgi:hypothetical protein